MTLDRKRRRELYDRRAAWMRLPSPRVLLADDDADIRGCVAAALQMDGFSVIEVGSGDQLIEDLGSALLFGEPAAIDVIISDIRMPGLTGLQVLASVRGLNVKTPVVLITAFADEALRAEAMRLGADAFFKKPFDIDELRRVVNRAAGWSPPVDLD